MIDSSVSSLADVLSLFPSLKPYHHGVEKPVIPIFPHEKRPQSWLSSALTGEKAAQGKWSSLLAANLLAND